MANINPDYVEFLGTGTSLGVPMIGCKCDVCCSKDSKDKRFRTSLLIKYNNKNIVVDCGPDFRMQLLRANVHDLDAVIITHEHRDHIAGLDDLRSINYMLQKKVQLYVSNESFQALRVSFPYIFEPGDYKGGPQLEVLELSSNPFELVGLRFIPLQVMHRNMKVYGFRMGDFSYITDANYIPDSTMELLNGSRILVLNALRKEKHPSHFNLEEAIAIAQEVRAEKTYFTHLSHLIGKHQEENEKLPPNMALAYDGLSIRF
jgi:phosphoribosyl 1,2-cyclic phosphate phosphodiesterase